MISQKQPIPRASLHHHLVDLVRDLISKGELNPGEKIPEKELCLRFGVSRTPLREALKVLASEGVVTLTPNRGATVASLTVEEIREVFPVMGALEALAGEIACSRITPAEFENICTLHDRMVRHWQDRQLQPYFRLNQAIHEAILQATGNDTLQSLYRSLATRLVSVRYMADMSDQRWARAVAEHEQMIAALRDRDGPRLGRILRKHLATKLETVQKWLETERRPADAP